jgi:ADP-ribosylglycohydrolase
MRLPTEEKIENSILGCWLGKNCGGTLGAPLEIAYGKPEPFDVRWYPKIQKGGLPNDDLEIQLVWLKVLEEVGLDFTEHDLARYWLNHVCYNPDEYGMHKRNLALGLRPPISGFYNNYFTDCMGCPIRSEIWACIAAGNPLLATRFALRDAIVDHAGGESVYGELFNVAIQAAAFTVKDRDVLLAIGLSYLPKNSLTRMAVEEAIDSHRAGRDWKEARRRILGPEPHINAQYSPPNIGFQIVGWLYGRGFGDALCKAVNCGYDTDCTGATLGATLGIIGGAKTLPEKWTAPLGNQIAINDWELNRGTRFLRDGPNPIPETLEELTDRTMRIYRQVRARYGTPPVFIADMMAPKDLAAEISPTRVTFARGDLVASVDYESGPQIQKGKKRKLTLEIKNPNPVAVHGRLRVVVPSGWTAHCSELKETIPAQGAIRQSLTLLVGKSATFGNRNVCWFGWEDDKRPFQRLHPIALVGAPLWRVSKPFVPAEKSESKWIDWPGAPEKARGRAFTKNHRKGLQTLMTSDGFDLHPEQHLTKPGVLYYQCFLNSPDTRKAWFHLNPVGPAALWLNGRRIFISSKKRRFRPSLWGTDEGELHGEVLLAKGWNEILIKVVRLSAMPEVKLHFLFSVPPVEGYIDAFEAMTDVEWVSFPWKHD